jgi:hypothetical protein
VIVTRTFDVAFDRVKGLSERSGARFRTHLSALSELWFNGVLVSGLNFVSLLLIVWQSTVDVFAGYTLSLSMMIIVGALADGGLASTFGTLAADASGESHTFRQYQGLYRRLAPIVTPIGVAFGVLLAVFVGLYTRVPLGRQPWLTLTCFSVLGAGMAYTSQTSAFLYARGLFRDYSKNQAIGPATRAVLIGAAVLYGHGLTLRWLFVLTAASTAVSVLASHRYRNSCTSDAVINPELRREVTRFLVPTGVAVVLNAVAYHVTALGGSLYATSAAIGTYGVFMRTIQIIALLFTPVASYGTRQIRLGTQPGRERREGRLLTTLSSAYAVYALAALAMYALVSGTFRHYALGHPVEFAIFLAYCGISSIQVWIDSILGARSYARHRIVGTALQCSMNVLLLPLLRPQTLRSLVLIDLTSACTIGLYYIQQLGAARRLAAVKQC